MEGDDVILGLLIGIFALMGVTVFLIVAPPNYVGEIRLNSLSEMIRNTGSEGCEGIEEYYTGKGFWYDSQLFMKAYWNMRDGNDMYLENKFEILPPKRMGWDTYDCEDVARGIWCISEQYNIECDFYFQDNHDHHGMMDHIGAECLFGDDWIEIS